MAADNEIEENVNYQEMFKTISVIFISMGLGTILEMGFTKLGVTFPSYIDAMIIAAIILNTEEKVLVKWKINSKCTDIIGNVSLNIFLSMALIELQLWELKVQQVHYNTTYWPSIINGNILLIL